MNKPPVTPPTPPPTTPPSESKTLEDQKAEFTAEGAPPPGKKPTPVPPVPPEKGTTVPPTVPDRPTIKPKGAAWRSHQT